MDDEARLDALLDEILVMQSKRTPEQVARDVAEVARQDARLARPIRDRAIEAAQRLNPEQARAVMARKRDLAISTCNEPATLAALREANIQLEDHPLTLVLADLFSLAGSGVPWLEEHILHEKWNWLWCAHDLGLSIEQYAKSVEPEVLASIKAAAPYPADWQYPRKP